KTWTQSSWKLRRLRDQPDPARTQDGLFSGPLSLLSGPSMMMGCNTISRCPHPNLRSDHGRKVAWDLPPDRSPRRYSCIFVSMVGVLHEFSCTMLCGVMPR